ncbi:hypothetical protein HGRIS_010018 [Hohenbuehelia grisea]|uniref:Uncharacterized protein n=1 Tax=Hohenbuehelia grisea TaxID=104357 RepID=A0ABR3J3H4_9AGAR
MTDEGTSRPPATLKVEPDDNVDIVVSDPLGHNEPIVITPRRIPAWDELMAISGLRDLLGNSCYWKLYSRLVHAAFAATVPGSVSGPPNSVTLFSMANGISPKQSQARWGACPPEEKRKWVDMVGALRDWFRKWVPDHLHRQRKKRVRKVVAQQQCSPTPSSPSLSTANITRIRSETPASDVDQLMDTDEPVETAILDDKYNPPSDFEYAFDFAGKDEGPFSSITVRKVHKDVAIEDLPLNFEAQSRFAVQEKLIRHIFGLASRVEETRHGTKYLFDPPGVAQQGGG